MNDVLSPDQRARMLELLTCLDEPLLLLGGAIRFEEFEEIEEQRDLLVRLLDDILTIAEE